VQVFQTNSANGNGGGGGSRTSSGNDDSSAGGGGGANSTGATAGHDEGYGHGSPGNTAGSADLITMVFGRWRWWGNRSKQRRGS